MKTKTKHDQFSEMCGTCKFCHEGKMSNFNCWVEPPTYAGYFDEDEPVFVRGQADVKVNSPACRFYIHRNPQ